VPRLRGAVALERQDVAGDRSLVGLVVHDEHERRPDLHAFLLAQYKSRQNRTFAGGASFYVAGEGRVTPAIDTRRSSFYLEALTIALQSIFAHKLRSLLTLTGIIIGVASVVVVGAAISGMNSYVVERVASVLGVNHFMMARMAHVGDMSDEEWQRMDRRNKRLEWDDFQAVLRRCPSCTEVGAQLNNRLDLRRGNDELLGVQIAGVTANMDRIEDKKMDDGRFLLPHEVDHAAPVVVLGMDVKDRLFPLGDALGRTLRVAGAELRVVGIESRRGSMFGDSLDKHVYIPITTFGRLFGRHQSLQIHGLGASRESFLRAIDEARVAMRVHHKLRGREEDDFGLVNVDEVNTSVDQFTGAIAMVVTPITLISLVVGGIVVMNIMLVTVNERTFEIGLRKAIGARRREIMLQFLIESAVLCAVGGVLGLLLAAAVSGGIRAATGVTMVITLGYVVLALAVSSLVGILAGIYPARRAAKLDPVVALTRS
jgi:putative ABC transport system permease protein